MLYSYGQITDETGGGKKRTRETSDLDESIPKPKRQKVQSPQAPVIAPQKPNSKQFLPLSSATLIGPNQSQFQLASPKTFTAFHANLKQYAQGAPCRALAKHLSKEDFGLIFDYFTINANNNNTTEAFAKKTKALLPDQTLMLDKRQTGLPRTLKITRSAEGVFELFVESMTPPKTFRQFHENVTESKSYPASKDLLKLISLEDLQKIFDYFTTNSENNPTVEHYARQIFTLAPNQSIRLDKHKTHLPRTLNVIRSHEGEYLLLLETKSKLADGTKQKLPQVVGSFKSGKPSWRIDSGELEYFNLVTPLKKPKDLEDLQNEVAISQRFSNQQIDTKLLGAKFEKSGLSKISIYSPKANCGSLRAFMKSKEYATLAIQQKYSLLLDIFKGIKAFHDQNLAYQDIKPSNILIEGNPEIGYHAIVTDFGTVSLHHNQDDWPLATLGYQSPEITALFQKPNPADNNYTYLYDYFNNKQYLPTLAHQCLPSAQSDGAPNKANDLWSLGVVAYEMLFNKLPLLPEAKSNIENNPLIKGLLEPNRRQRFTVEQAIDVLENLLKPAKAINFLPKF